MNMENALKEIKWIFKAYELGIILEKEKDKLIQEVREKLGFCEKLKQDKKVYWIDGDVVDIQGLVQKIYDQVRYPKDDNWHMVNVKIKRNKDGTVYIGV